MGRRSIRPILILLALATAAPEPTCAQQPVRAPELDPAKATAIRRVLELTKAAELAVAGIEATLPAQRAANPQIPSEFWDEFVARARSSVPALIELLVPIYAVHLTREEAEQLAEFYQSPLGRRLAEVQPLILQESMQAGQQWGAQIGAEVAQELARKGIRIP